MPTPRAPLSLGLFMPNCSYAYSISTYKPEVDDWTYASNLKIAQAAERAGFDFLFPVAKWKGYGGKTNYLGTSLETMTWASALLANTQRIQVFSTVHVPIFHPLVAAKMGATLDHIGNGRWGLNVVSGWSEREFGQMHIDVMPHAERYARTSDYIEIIKAGLHLADVSLFALGTTVATNALIQRNLPPTAMVVTAGFRDVIEIGNSTKEDLWDAYRDNPPPYIRRRNRLPIAERTDTSGKIEQAIDPLERRFARSPSCCP